MNLNNNIGILTLKKSSLLIYVYFKMIFTFYVFISNLTKFPIYTKYKTNCERM